MKRIRKNTASYIAKQIGVTPHTINEAIKELFPGITVPRTVTRLTEEQVAKVISLYKEE